MAEEREVTITIKGKNLTQPQFDAARKQLAGVGAAGDDAGARTGRLGDAFKRSGADSGIFSSQLSKLASAFAIGSLIDRGVGALFSFGQAAIASAGNLVDLRGATGNSLEALQRWTHVADQGGIQLENLTKASFQLGAKLSSGNGSVREAVERLGLSFSALKGLKPEAQMDEILKAAEAMGPSQERNTLLVQVFGEKGALALARVVDGWTATSAAASVAGDKQIEAIDRAADAWNKFKKDVGTGFAQAMGNVVIHFTDTAAAVDRLSARERQHFNMLVKSGGDAAAFLAEIEKTRQASAAAALPVAAAVAQAQRNYTAELQKTRDQVRAIDGPTRRQIAAAMELGVKTEELSNQYGISERALKLLSSTQREAEATTKRNAEAAAKAAKESIIWGDGMDGVEREAAELHRQILLLNKDTLRFADILSFDMTPPMDNFSNLMVDSSGRIVGYTKSIAQTGKEGAAAAKATSEWADKTGARLAPALDRVGVSLRGAKRDTDALGDSAATTAAKLRDGLLKNLQGVPQTLASAFTGGGNIEGAMKGIAGNLGSSLAKSAAFALGATGPWGQAIAGAVGSLAPLLFDPLKKLFGIGVNDEVKKANVEIGKVRNALLGTYGTLDELEAKAQSVGMSFKDAWGHQGQAGLAAMNTLAQEFKKRWDGMNESLATSRGELNGLIKQGADLGYTFDENGKLVNVSVEKMRETAQKFGLDVKALGPSFDQAGLRTRIDEVINGFTLMDKGGTSTGVILTGMKDEINAIVNDSIKFGTDIPENMRPWITNLIETGQLTDANGVKMTELTGIKFGEPVATEFEKISKKIGELIEAIKTMVDKINTTITPAIDNAFRDRTVRVGFDVEDPPEFNFSGRRGGERSGGFARGTFGTLGVDFPDFSTGTRTVVHGREAIVPYAERFAFADRVRSGSAAAPAPAPQIKIDVHFVNDNTGVRQVTESEFRQIQDRINAGGITVPVRAISQRGR